MDHPLRPPLLDSTDSIDKAQEILEITLWCTAGMPNHWITSYKYTSSIKKGPNNQLYEGVSLDMHQPLAHVYHPSGQGNIYGCLHISARPKNKLLSTKAKVAVTMAVQTTVTVGDVINLVVEDDRQFYKFHPDGSGCLYWQTQLLRRFVNKGWLKQKQLDALWIEVEEHANRVGQDMVPYPPAQGVFYTPPH
ncbi:hypothetical protein BV20DRAFT_960239 [Pilatotrama ljubarskyi]|nr:hypothetical protein BV20DRAFT_960239 [Pilatotrama ljubarskyi]